ncbi:MAG: DUF1015 family protein [Gammaproteobacteria bacterium]|nr:DUF1015 family protein [Gammaproteobacteria bacterium]
MPVIFPFNGYLVSPDHATEVVTPPYDQLTPAERHEFAQTHTNNYINTMRTTEEYEDKTLTVDTVLKGNAAKLQALLNNGIFVESGKPCLYLYRLAADEHEQIGVVAEIPIDDYAHGVLKKHEHTRNEHEDNLTRYHEVVGASSSPVCVAYKEDKEISTFIRSLAEAKPDLDFTLDDGLSQSLWCIEDEAVQKKLIELFGKIPETYLTDGHHRAASGLRYAVKCRARHPDYTGDEPFNYLLVAMFADEVLRILPWHRCVQDLNGHDPVTILRAIEKDFLVDQMPGAAQPQQPREFTMLLDGQWYRLMLRSGFLIPEDPVDSLDVSILQNEILKPVFGINDPRTDSRLANIPGAAGISALEEKIRQGWSVAFCCYNTSIQELMAVADADQVMPPKSTWLDPKVRSGIFVRMR